jgi:3-deoxy-D-manno-octulosonate 8-phosphate phosphatase (KDO 8-P phosphatase)
LVKLSDAELAARAARIRLVLTDCDGVLTDAGVYVSERGEELKRFSLRDGMGVERLREAGIATAIVTRERSPIVARRAEKLGIQLYEGVRDKRAALPQILADTGVSPDSVAYLGDDVNDLGIIAAVGEAGLTGAPSDAEPEVAAAVHLHGGRCGGYGALREFAETILRLRAPARGGRS